MRELAIGVTVGFAIVGGVDSAVGQPLIDQLPADAVVYVGWQGAEERDELAASRLGSVIGLLGGGEEAVEATQQGLWGLGEMLELPVLSKAARHPTLVEALWRRPWAMSVSQADEGAGDVVFQWVWNPGADDDALRASLERITGDLQDVALYEADGVLGLVSGPVGPQEGSLGEDASFQALLQTGQFEPALVAYLDQQGLESLFLGEAQDNGAMAEWEAVLGQPGRMIYLAGPEGQDWQARWFFEAPTPREGWMRVLDAGPMDEAVLKHVPRDALWFVTHRVDVPLILEEAPSLMVAMDDATHGLYQGWVGEMEAVAGIKLTEVAQALGDTWLVYGSASAEGGFMGVCLVIPVSDTEVVREAMTGFMRVIERRTGMVIRSDDRRGLRVRWMETPIIRPAWALIDGALYLALSPATLQEAHRHVVQGRPSVLDHRGYQRWRQSMGVEQVWSVQFTDLRRSAPAAANTHRMMLYWADYAVPEWDLIPAGDWFPSLAELDEHLRPAGAVQWVDEHGLHGSSREPFAGSMALSEGVYFGPGALTGGLELMLPALERIRDTARMIQTASDVKRIQLVRQQQAEAFDDVWPLVASGALGLEDVLSPWDEVDVPRWFDMWTPQQQERWVRENASYVVVPRGEPTAEMGRVSAFMRPRDDLRATAVVFENESAGWVWDLEALDEQLREQTGMGMEALIERQRATNGSQ